MRDLLDWLELTDEQRAAVTPRGQDLLLTAGAGTGKTRTLVARYLSLLAEGISPRRIVAITFTEKAAREMRNRIRQRIAAWVQRLKEPEERARWRATMRAMESARIGTIHSLCAEILRAQPAAAQLDPEFEVLDEGAAALLKAEAVDQAMVEAANHPELAQLFEDFSVWGLRRLLIRLIGARLDAATALEEGGDREEPVGDRALRAALRDFHTGASPRINDLRELEAQGYFTNEATDSMTEMVAHLLTAWNQFESRIEAEQWVGAATELFSIRRRHLRGGVGRGDGPARPLIDEMRTIYLRSAAPWLGGERASDAAPDPEREARYGSLRDPINRLVRRMLAIYEDALRARAALDFDALEAMAADLLTEPAIRRQWQGALDHVLVDEFQDTNRRQQRIVQALTGEQGGELFVVGDARQSIYRFRGADVTVFQRMSRAIEGHGHALELRRTFRQHRGLLDQYDRLLPAIMSSNGGQGHFWVSYTPLAAERSDPLAGTAAPYVSFLLGLGRDADEGRGVAAAALADRLRAMHEAGEIVSWDQVALLFRASSGFAHYEDTLEAQGIPFVTIAGRGFYDRPEIREVLNALRALAEPWNEAAMAGLLRSSLIGMSDVGLYRLRVGPEGPLPFRHALSSGVDGLSEQDEEARVRANEFLATLRPLVDRLPVAELLKRLVDHTDARAVMAVAGQRQWTNLDKLLADARASQATRVRGFLDYLQATREAGVREGEALAEGEGAVRLLTVHRAKGLEFDFVVLADAAYARGTQSEPAYLLEGTGLACRPDLWQGDSLSYRLARAADHAREAAEEARLLYVAATRAREKWIVSGHLTERGSSRSAAGWLGQLLAALGVSPDDLSQGPQRRKDGSGLEIEVELAEEAVGPSGERVSEAIRWPRGKKGLPLYKPVAVEAEEETDRDYDEQAPRDWRATGRRRPPAVVVGEMVHRAIERWLFPPSEALDRLLEASALSQGLVEAEQRQAAIERSRELLARLRDHPVKDQIEASEERYHELPFTYQPTGKTPDSGDFDLLYRWQEGWRIVDFKTDLLRTEEDLRSAIEEHRQQIERYLQAGQALLPGPVAADIIFLDDRGQVRIERPA